MTLWPAVGKGRGNRIALRAANLKRLELVPSIPSYSFNKSLWNLHSLADQTPAARPELVSETFFRDRECHKHLLWLK